MISYLLSTLEGCIVSTIYMNELLDNDDKVTKFAQFSATLYQLFKTEKVLYYQYDWILCVSSLISDTSIYITLLYK